METIKAANKIIKDGIELLPDDLKGEFKARMGDIFINEGIANAMGAINENEEKESMLYAYAIQEANRVVGTLWREQLLTPEMEAEYRALPPIKGAADKYNTFMDDRKKRMEEVVKLHNGITNEEKDLEIFMGIINGISAKEAEKRYEEQQQQMRNAMQGR